MKTREHLGFPPLIHVSSESTLSLRDFASKWVSLHVIELLVAATLLVLLSFFHAWVDGMIPEEWSRTYGNHGPWRHYPRGRGPLDQALNILMYACVVSGLLGIVKRERGAIALSLVCLGCLMMAIYFLYWIVD
jgi:hypothetical protein